MRLRWRLWSVNGHLWLLVAIPSVETHAGLAVLVRHRVRCTISVRITKLLVHVMVVHVRLVEVRLVGIVMVRLTPAPATAAVAVAVAVVSWRSLAAISNRSMTMPILMAVGSSTPATTTTAVTSTTSSSLRGWLPSRQVVAHLAGLGGDGSQCWTLLATIPLYKAEPDMRRTVFSVKIGWYIEASFGGCRIGRTM